MNLFTVESTPWEEKYNLYKKLSDKACKVAISEIPEHDIKALRDRLKRKKS